MFGKLLLTLAIVGLAYLVIRSRSRQVAAQEVVDRRQGAEQAVSPRTVAYIFLAVAALTGGGIYLFEWLDDRQVITIRLINSRTGEAAIYQAYKGKIRSRQFETLDGRSVTIADEDRVEMVDGD